MRTFPYESALIFSGEDTPMAIQARLSRFFPFVISFLPIFFPISEKSVILSFRKLSKFLSNIE